ncbi:MAG: hypothetical protein UT05_C0011G0024 [Parcubacteria group bacterium GW2011_GWF2_38_76]|nr:MAG: hypothetical protein UT05_C0011G0024 [Parcubacteria group bacterium GW2011_GWF2_38_76]HBM45380.1 hypothetical protein [Patescibacteria group bacterium]
MNINSKDLEIGTLEYPKGLLREALKQKLKSGRDPRKSEYFPGFIPVYVADSGALSVDAIWCFVDKEELKSMWEEIDKENDKAVTTKERNPTRRGLILRPGINVGQVKDEFFLPR